MTIKKLLMIVCGGVASYKVLDFSRNHLMAGNFKLSFLLTKHAKHFITPLSLSTLTGSKVYEDEDFFSKDTHIKHIELARNHDAIVVFAATARMIAAISQGLSDDFASTCILATKKPVFFIPAMNASMWQHPAVQRNIAQLKRDTYHIIEPETGMMACKESGVGRLASFTTIEKTLSKVLNTCDTLKNKRVLITSGATWEAIDAVRGLSNLSSGKQGLCLYDAFSNAGAKVDLIAAKHRVSHPALKHAIHVNTAQNMFDIVQKKLLSTHYDIAIAVAAVSDFTVLKSSKEKIKKTAGPPSIKLVATPDILEYMGHCKNRPRLLIGFAAETSQLDIYAKEKRLKKNTDLIVANDVSNGQVFGSDTNTVHFYDSTGKTSFATCSKQEVANQILNWSFSFLSK